jgi:hypothetical protein
MSSELHHLKHLLLTMMMMNDGDHQKMTKNEQSLIRLPMNRSPLAEEEAQRLLLQPFWPMQQRLPQ